MAVEHPPTLPELFLDRSLGRHLVPSRLRAAGLRLRRLAEVYGVPEDETVTDIEWLGLAGRSGWVALMKDERIRYRTAEKQALRDSSLRAFCLTGGNLTADQMAERFLAHLPRMAAVSASPGPFLYVVTRGGVREVEL